MTLQKQFEKVTVQKFLVELFPILPHTQFDQISDHKHDTYLSGKLFTKLLAQVANKNTKFMFTKTGWFFFLKFDFKSDCPKKL